MTKKIVYSRRFVKHFRNRVSNNKKLVKKTETRVEKFLIDPKDQTLKDHALTGNLAGFRAFSITGDVRIVYYEELGKYKFVDIGTHSQIYGS